MNAKDQRIGKCIRAILGDVKADIVLVMHRFVVVNYFGFLPVETLQPILQSVCEDQTLVLMRNASHKEWDWAVDCTIAAVNRERFNPMGA